MLDNVLRLHPQMTGTRLIQRLQKPFVFKVGDKMVDNPFSFGGGLRNGGLSEDAMGLLRGIMSFDYMGSAEFEFGAVPRAFRFLAERASKGGLVSETLDCGGHLIWIISPTEYAQEVRKRISDLFKDEYKFRLKEHCGLKDALTSEKDYHKRTCGWLELDNGFMFFTDETMYSQVCELFGLS